MDVREKAILEIQLQANRKLAQEVDELRTQLQTQKEELEVAREVIERVKHSGIYKYNLYINEALAAYNKAVKEVQDG